MVVAEDGTLHDQMSGPGAIPDLVTIFIDLIVSTTHSSNRKPAF
jgi:hypothetical protein